MKEDNETNNEDHCGETEAEDVDNDEVDSEDGRKCEARERFTLASFWMLSRRTHQVSTASARTVAAGTASDVDEAPWDWTAVTDGRQHGAMGEGTGQRPRTRIAGSG